MQKEIVKDQIELALKEINDKDCNVELLYDYLHEALNQINLTIPIVSKQRELLIAYGEWIHGLAGEKNNELATRLADKYISNL